MNDFDSIIKRITVTRLEPGDYTGEDGLLYCGKCRTPKQFRMEAPPLEGRLLPHPCRCEQERIDREAAEKEAPHPHYPFTRRPIPQAIVQLIASTIHDVSDEDGWAFMGELGNILPRRQPDFDPRNYGFEKLTTLVKSIDRFEIDARPTSAPNVKHIYVRDKRAKNIE